MCVSSFMMVYTQVSEIEAAPSDKDTVKLNKSISTSFEGEASLFTV